jgi:hypothetical protein
MSVPVARPVLLADQVDDGPLELGGVLDAVLRLAEDHAESALLTGEFLEHVLVGELQLVAVGVEEALPGARLRDDVLRLDRARGSLVRHLEEQQVRQLLGVLDRGHGVVAQRAAERPEPVDVGSGQLIGERPGSPQPRAR